MKIHIEIDTTEPAPPDIPELVSEVLVEAAGNFHEMGKDRLLRSFIDAAESAGMTVGPMKASGEYEYTRPSWDDPFKLTYTVEITL